MNPTTHAVKVGLRRGWRATVLSMKSPQDQVFYVVMAIGVLVYMFWNRNTDMGDSGLTFPQYALPSMLAGLIVFGLVMGPAYELTLEREDGTLLRAKTMPRGLLSYTVGQIVYNSLGLVPMLAIILIPSFILFEGVAPAEASGWLRIAGFIVLGLVALLPLGIILGAVVPNAQKVGTWGMMPVVILSITSGALFPIQQLWGWLQGVAQVFPVYWLGLGLRSGFLPEGAAAWELHESWLTGVSVVVLLAWAALGLIVAPRVLSRMAKRQSGSAMQEAKEQAGQWIK